MLHIRSFFQPKMLCTGQGLLAWKKPLWVGYISEESRSRKCISAATWVDVLIFGLSCFLMHNKVLVWFPSSSGAADSSCSWRRFLPHRRPARREEHELRFSMTQITHTHTHARTPGHRRVIWGCSGPRRLGRQWSVCVTQLADRHFVCEDI